LNQQVVLVRHTEVARAWHGRCYGISDIPLSRSGRTAMTALAARLAAERPTWVVHSGLVRTCHLANRIVMLAGCTLHEDEDWRERDFGTWEGQNWKAIYRATGSAMDRMLTSPDEFRPGGGETTMELAARVNGAFRRLPRNFGFVITHGGPIAALIGTQRAVPVTSWATLIPRQGETIRWTR
jgi:broad specificity phosphatase PhoE